MNSYKIQYRDELYQCKDSETLLDALIRQGVNLSFSCRKGSCHACLMRCVEGNIPGKSQVGVRKEYIENNYFLPCSCYPTGDMVVEDIGRESLIISGIVHQKEKLSEDICRLLIEPSASIDYRAGQFMNLFNRNGLSRSYSLASLPDDYYLEFHIKRMPKGIFSNWVFDALDVGDSIDMQGPYGDCYYHANTNKDTPILLLGKSSGLAPLVGVFRDAIAHGHTGDIHMYHIGDKWQDIYHGDFLKRFSMRHQHVYFFQGVVTSDGNGDDKAQELLDIVNNAVINFKDSVIYMAGSQAWLEPVRKQLLQYGASADMMYIDPYEFTELRKLRQNIPSSGRRSTDEKKQDIDHGDYDHEKPIEGIWEALGNGEKLNLILQEFYGMVYADDRLSPYFHNTTKQRSIEKQFLFLRQKFTGEKVYLGDRPRNAHHWMVISNDLFDYRKSILHACMSKYCLDDNYIKAWLDLEETFRRDIVKQEPWPKLMNGVELPLNGYEVLQMDVGTLCDGCHNGIESGQTVRYHVRLGLTYCAKCMNSRVE